MISLFNDLFNYLFMYRKFMKLFTYLFNLKNYYYIIIRETWINIYMIKEYELNYYLIKKIRKFIDKKNTLFNN